jgi:hypothetical protein
MFKGDDIETKEHPHVESMPNIFTSANYVQNKTNHLKNTCL